MLRRRTCAKKLIQLTKTETDPILREIRTGLLAIFGDEQLIDEVMKIVKKAKRRPREQNEHLNGGRRKSILLTKPRGEARPAVPVRLV